MLFNNPRSVVYLIVLFVLIFLGAFVWQQAHGAVLEFEGGNTIVRGSTQAIGAKVVWPGTVTRIGDLGCGFLLIGTSHSADGREQPNQIVGHCQVIGNYPTSRWGTFSSGVGLASIQNQDYYNLWVGRNSSKKHPLPSLSQQGSISPTFYKQLLSAQIPKAQKRLSS